MIIDKVKKIIAEQMGISEEEIKPETTFEDLGADSLDRFQIIMTLEEEFEIEIPNEASENIKTVGDTVAYIESKQK